MLSIIFTRQDRIINQANWIEENDGFGLVRRGLLPVLSFGGIVRQATVPSLHLHGLDKMDPPGVFSAVDAILQEGDLRVVRSPVLVYADILAGHASQTAYPRRGGRAGDVRRVCR